MDSECLFCRIAAQEIPAQELYRDSEIMAFRDITPQAPTHLLIIPVAHTPSVAELSDRDQTTVGKLILVARDLAREQGLERDGYRLIINTRAHAGQEVDHLHLHLLGGEPLGPMRSSK